MYKIYADERLVYSPGISGKGFSVISPKVTMEAGKAGSATFILPPDNEQYDGIEKMKTDIIIYQDGYEIFRGRVLDDKKDFYNRKNIYVEGELSFLLDSPVRPYAFQGDIPVLFRQLVENHNRHVDKSRQFRMGQVTVTDPNHYINRSNSNYSTTFDELKNKLVATHGGYLRSRRSGGHRYLDYLADYDDTNSQMIEFGVNLLDMTQYVTAKDMYTCLIPVGAVLDEETGERLTIASVNGGRDYLEHAKGIELYGRIWKTVCWDDVTQPVNLYHKGIAELNASVNMSMSLDIKAVDMHLLNVDTQRIRVGQKIRVISKPHGIDEYFDCTKITLDLANPGKSVYTLGATHTTITDQQSTTAKSSMTVADMAQAAVDSATSAAQSAQAAVTQVAGKQDKLVAGDNITIDPVTNVISSTGGSSVVVDDTISGTSENPVQNKVIKAALDLKQDTMTVDNAISGTSENPVQNKVIKAALDLKQDTMTVDNAISGTSENPVQNKVIKVALDLKQDKLTAGSNINIDPVTNVISSTGGSSVTVDNTISGTSENPVQNKVIKAALDLKQDTMTAGSNITIDPVTNVISATAAEYYLPLIYSTDEREVGVWTDGKPLYQKTFVVDNPQAGDQTYSLGISNLEKVVEQFGTWTRRWDVYGSIHSWTYNINSENEIMPSFQPQFQVLARVRDTDGVFYTYYPTTGAYSQAVSQIRLTIQYTKTTDTAGSGIWTPSGVPAVHYSTDEQVVGTWIDGSTLYERTIFTNPTWPSKTASIQLTNEICKSIEGGVCDSSGGNLIPFGYSGPNVYVTAYQGGNTIALYNSFLSSRNYAQITIRYTKSA